MAKNEALSGFWVSMLSPAIYKRTQGKRVRQTTAGLIIVWVIYGCYTLANGPLLDATREVRLVVPVVVGAVLSWIAYRVVNIPQFADFLIAVEVEMKKISWPTMQRCFRAGAVVIITMFFMAAMLFIYDQVWIWFFEKIGVLKI
ncbi:MAG TPA: preprotein translocase subunit SecE [Planctomycetaceae bacterium]|nr:preprotein translocase subunit SecE [Planctomycetaceae bacterium]